MKRFLELAPRVYVTTLASAISIAIYLGLLVAQWAHGVAPPPEALGRATPLLLWSGELWRLPLSVLHHGDFFHLAFNLIWLWLLGPACELTLGSKRYALFLLSAALVSSAAVHFPLSQPAIGLSGVIYAVFGLMLHLRRVNVFCAQSFSPQLVWMGVVWLFLCLPLSALWPISNLAHFSGILYGLAAGWTLVGVGAPRRRIRIRRAIFVAAHLLLIPAYWLIWRPMHSDIYYFQRGHDAVQAEEKIEWYQRAIALRGRLPYLHALRMQLVFPYKMTFHVNGDFPEAQFNLGLALSLEGRHEEVVDCFATYLAMDFVRMELSNRAPDALRWQALSFWKLQRYAEARKAQARLEEIDEEEGRMLKAELMRDFLRLPPLLRVLGELLLTPPAEANGAEKDVE